MAWLATIWRKLPWGFPIFWGVFNFLDLKNQQAVVNFFESEKPDTFFLLLLRSVALWLIAHTELSLSTQYSNSK